MATITAHADWTLAWWDWWFNLNWWQGLLVALAITPFGLWVWRWMMQGIVVNPLTHDWMSFNCDVFVGSLGVGAMLYIASTMPPGSGVTHGAWYPVINYGAITLWVGFGALHMWQERNEVGSWRRRLGATSVYHFAVFAFFAPFMTVLFVNTLMAPWDTPQRIALHLAPFLALALWLSAGMFYDPKHQLAPDGQSKHVYTSPVDGWRNLRRFKEWLTKSTDLAFQSGTLGPWNFIINRYPLQGFLVLVMVSPGAFLFLNWAMRSEWIPFSYQWYSALIGDVLLALLGLYLLWRLAKLAWSHYPVFERRIWHYFWIMFWYAFAAAHMWQERNSVDSWERRFGANSVYHNFVVYPLLGYAMIVLLWLTLKYSTWRWRVVTILVTVALVGGWYALGVYDGAHQFAPNGVSKHEYSSPEDGWRNLRIVYEWFEGRLTR